MGYGFFCNGGLEHSGTGVAVAAEATTLATRYCLIGARRDDIFNTRDFWARLRASRSCDIFVLPVPWTAVATAVVCTFGAGRGFISI